MVAGSPDQLFTNSRYGTGGTGGRTDTGELFSLFFSEKEHVLGLIRALVIAEKASRKMKV